jgi:hypothetical protein
MNFVVVTQQPRDTTVLLPEGKNQGVFPYYYASLLSSSP